MRPRAHLRVSYKYLKTFEIMFLLDKLSLKTENVVSYSTVEWAEVELRILCKAADKAFWSVRCGSPLSLLA